MQSTLPPKLVGLSISEATTISLLFDLPSLAARSWNTISRSKLGVLFFQGIIFFWTSVHSVWLSVSAEFEPIKTSSNMDMQVVVKLLLHTVDTSSHLSTIILWYILCSHRYNSTSAEKQRSDWIQIYTATTYK